MAWAVVAQHGGLNPVLFHRRRGTLGSPSRICQRKMLMLGGRHISSAASEMDLKPCVMEKTKYNDNWFSRLAIRHISDSIDAVTGVKRKGEGYEGLIEAASILMKKHSSKKQQDMVVEALSKAFPASVTAMLKAFLLPSKFTREFFAVFTTIFFAWLVGPCEVKESDFQGRKEKNVVYIPKCRFLEATNCVGMCTNLCKVPSQKFISDKLGMPTNMVPNFEDKSCEMIFGQHPIADDPALKQPCYRTLCIARQTHGVGCSS